LTQRKRVEFGFSKKAPKMRKRCFGLRILEFFAFRAGIFNNPCLEIMFSVQKIGRLLFSSKL
jgi:hypothetical protein